MLVVEAVSLWETRRFFKGCGKAAELLFGHKVIRLQEAVGLLSDERAELIKRSIRSTR